MEENQDNQPRTEEEKLRAQCAEYLAGWQRAQADFMNFKREESARIQSARESEREILLHDLLPIVDNLERAERELTRKSDGDSIGTGFLQIAKQLKEYMKKQGLEELATETGMFDPAVHEAIAEEETEEKEPGTIVEVLEKGYTMDGKLLRPAKVKIAKEHTV